MSRRHKNSGEVWREVSRSSERMTVRVERQGVQRILWIAYWDDGETWEPVA